MFDNSFNFSNQTNLTNVSNSESITNNPLIIFGISVASLASLCLLSRACHEILSGPIKSFVRRNQQRSPSEQPDPEVSSPRSALLQIGQVSRYSGV